MVCRLMVCRLVVCRLVVCSDLTLVTTTACTAVDLTDFFLKLALEVPCTNEFLRSGSLGGGMLSISTSTECCGVLGT